VPAMVPGLFSREKKVATATLMPQTGWWFKICENQNLQVKKAFRTGKSRFLQRGA
jgi:hypothetical protein